MRCFDGADVWKLFGVYILQLLRTVMRKKSLGLYRDDGLGMMVGS